MKIPWRRFAEPESIVLALSVANFARIGYLIERSSGIACLVCPWYHSWGYAYEPFRLLAAGIFVRVGRSWTQALAAVLAAQVFVEGFYAGVSPDQLLAVRAGIEEWPFLTQGIVGAAVLGVAWFRLARRERLRAWLRWPTRAAVAFMILIAAGIASNFSSYQQCENRVASWVAREMLGGKPFTAWDGFQGWGNSAAIFRRVGADVRKSDPDTESSSSSARVSAWHTTVPFVVRVHYAVDGRRMGERAFLCLFGLTWPLERTSWLSAVDRAVAVGMTIPWNWFVDRP